MSNSKEVLIPKPIFQQTGVLDASSLKVPIGVIDIHPIRRGLSEGWDIDSARVAAQDARLVWPELIDAEDASLQW
jgi:hypothetical protein